MTVVGWPVGLVLGRHTTGHFLLLRSRDGKCLNSDFQMLRADQVLLVSLPPSLGTVETSHCRDLIEESQRSRNLKICLNWS